MKLILYIIKRVQKSKVTMASPRIENDPLKRRKDPYEQYGMRPFGVGQNGNGNNVTKPGQNGNVVNVDTNNTPTVTTTPAYQKGAEAGASTQGSSQVPAEYQGSPLVQSLLTTDNITSPVDTGGTISAPVQGPSISSGVTATTGNGAENPQEGATGSKGGYQYNGQPNAEFIQNAANFGGRGNNILASAPMDTSIRPGLFNSGVGGSGLVGDNHPASEPKPTGEATLSTTNPEDSGKTKGEGKLGENGEEVNPNNPQDSDNPNVNNNPDITDNPDNPKNNGTDKPPETSKQIDKDAEKKAALEAERKAQEKAQQRAAEEAGEKAA